MDLTNVAIGGVSIAVLIPGLVEFSKKLGLKGNGLVVLAFVLGTLFAGVYGALELGLIPDAATPWVTVCVLSLGGGVAGLSLCGYYDLVKRAVEAAAKARGR